MSFGFRSMKSQSVDYFSEDIIHEILLRLPVKPLLRFSSVCKSWNAMIKNPSFIDSHLSRTIQSNDKNNTHLLLLMAPAKTDEKRSCAVYSLHWDNPELSEYTKLINPFVAYRSDTFYRDFKVVGICNGIVCLADYRSGTAIIWNPCIRKYMNLHAPSVSWDARTVRRESYVFDFCYDSHSKDYKVLRTLSFDGKQTLTLSKVEVWSLARGSWNTLTADNIPADYLPINYEKGKAFVDGVLYWVQIRRRNGEEEYCFIAWFDIHHYLAGEIAMPESLRKKADGSVCISRYQESLALFLSDDSDKARRREINGMCVWVMKEHAVVGSWTKLLTIYLQFTPPRPPFCFRKSGKIVFRTSELPCGNWELVSINPDPNCFQVESYYDSASNMYIRKIYTCCFMDHFVESLELFGHSNAIGYN